MKITFNDTKTTIFCILMIGLVLVSSCSKEAKNTQPQKEKEIESGNSFLNLALIYGSVTDIDGNKYATIKIGEQLWMAENLKTTKYNDGISIPRLNYITDWSSATEGGWCNFDNKSENDVLYGKLYNWYAVNTGKLCPDGWHIPTDDEWNVLYYYIKEKVGAEVIGFHMKSAKGNWIYGGGSNSTGFSGLPAGLRNEAGTFIPSNSWWWSSSPTTTGKAWSRSLYYSSSGMDRPVGGNGRKNGFSCRCMQD
ncbi:MAG: fibrobacter succinogenes major paralogous domain-containing protein [Bacteroidetes bacterium]|nr:fibrobacter succinogenes major paralogous domain-containing protein [Bacteroidota bacterium]